MIALRSAALPWWATLLALLAAVGIAAVATYSASSWLFLSQRLPALLAFAGWVVVFAALNLWALARAQMPLPGRTL